MSATIDAQLAVDALSMAFARQRPSAGLIVHSDRGSQYASSDFRDKLKEYRMRQSMSRRGNCYDNAPMESFFSSLKGEYLEHQRFATHEDARAAVFLYIETFYNPIRLHSSIGYRSPNEFESTFMRAAYPALVEVRDFGGMPQCRRHQTQRLQQGRSCAKSQSANLQRQGKLEGGRSTLVARHQ